MKSLVLRVSVGDIAYNIPLKCNDHERSLSILTVLPVCKAAAKLPERLQQIDVVGSRERLCQIDDGTAQTLLPCMQPRPSVFTREEANAGLLCSTRNLPEQHEREVVLDCKRVGHELVGGHGSRQCKVATPYIPVWSAVSILIP